MTTRWKPGDDTGVPCPCGKMPLVVWEDDEEQFARARCNCGKWSHFVLDDERFPGMQRWHATPGPRETLDGPADRLEARYQRQLAAGQLPQGAPGAGEHVGVLVVSGFQDAFGNPIPPHSFCSACGKRAHAPDPCEAPGETRWRMVKPCPACGSAFVEGEGYSGQGRSSEQELCSEECAADWNRAFAAQPCTCRALPGNYCPRHGPVQPVGLKDLVVEDPSVPPGEIHARQGGVTVGRLVMQYVPPAVSESLQGEMRARFDAVARDMLVAAGVNEAVPTPSPPAYRAARIRFPEGFPPADAAAQTVTFLAGMGLDAQTVPPRAPHIDWRVVGYIGVEAEQCPCDSHALVTLRTGLPLTWLPVMPEGSLWPSPITFEAFRALVPPPRPRSEAAANPMGWDSMGRRP